MRVDCMPFLFARVSVDLEMLLSYREVVTLFPFVRSVIYNCNEKLALITCTGPSPRNPSNEP